MYIRRELSCFTFCSLGCVYIYYPYLSFALLTLIEVRIVFSLFQIGIILCFTCFPVNDNILIFANKSPINLFSGSSILPLSNKHLSFFNKLHSRCNAFIDYLFYIVRQLTVLFSDIFLYLGMYCFATSFGILNLIIKESLFSLLHFGLSKLYNK